MAIFFIFWTAGDLSAEWSPEILLWEPPANATTGPYEAALTIDLLGGVHIIFRVHFRLDVEPTRIHGGVAYVKYDDQGNCLASPLLLGDSTDAAGSMLKIGTFGADSIMAMWYWNAFGSPTGGGHRTRSLSLEGVPLGPSQLWTGNLYGGSFSFEFSTRSDGKLTFAYANGDSAIRAVVCLPNGQRPLDFVDVWARSGQRIDGVVGFLDHTDSLQLMWRQRYFSDVEWDAIYAKRVATNVPFDSQHLDDYVALSPELSGHFSGPKTIDPIGDSLLLFQGGYLTGEISGVCSLSVLRRADYSQISGIQIGPLQAYTAVEGDTVASFMTFLEDRCTHFKLYTLPNLNLIQDTVLVCPGSQDYGGGPLAYGVSSTGIRHVVFTRTDLNMHVRYYYRYWRVDLAVSDRQVQGSNSQDFFMWPNPTNSTITLNGPVRKLKSLELYNVLGQCVWHESVGQDRDNTGLQINLDGFTSGIYFIRLVTRDNVSFHKICLIR